MEQFLQVGVISSTHGIRGEVKVFPTTDDAARFKKLKKVLLDTGKERLELEVQSVKFFKQFVIVKFRGIDNINDIEMYKGKSLLVPREDAVRLEKDEYYIADLLGMDVFTEDGHFGVLKDVMETGANEVYIIGSGSARSGDPPVHSRRGCGRAEDGDPSDGRADLKTGTRGKVIHTYTGETRNEFSYTDLISGYGDERAEHEHYRTCSQCRASLDRSGEYPGLCV